MASDAIIRVDNLSKRYRLVHQRTGRKTAGQDRLTEVLAGMAAAPFRALRRRAGAGDAAAAIREDFWALRDVSFEIGRGEVVGVIGRNGAGKSTLLKILSRITEPTRGRIEIDGRVASLLEVGTGFHPELTGRENIFLNGTILGMTRREILRSFDEIVAFAEVERFLDTPVKHYSSGMYVRLAFAVSAHLQPEILIVDEVLAVGDAQFQKKCIGKMGEVARGGRTVLFVSHAMDTILRLCQRVLLLKGGRLERSGDPAATIAHFLRQSGTQPARLDLGPVPRDGHPRRGMTLLDARLEKQGVHDWAVPSGEPVGLVFTVRVDTLLKAPDFGVSLFSLTGTEIVSALGSHGERKIAFARPGTYELTYRFPDLVLVPGSYTVRVGIRSERGLEDYLPEAFSFEVTPSEYSAARQLDTFRGFVVPRVELELAERA